MFVKPSREPSEQPTTGGSPVHCLINPQTGVVPLHVPHSPQHPS
jgi:hypothetical protein